MTEPKPEKPGLAALRVAIRLCEEAGEVDHAQVLREIMRMYLNMPERPARGSKQ